MAFADIFAAVRAATSDPRQQSALLFACGAESGCQPIQNAAGAPAYGPWQIYLPYHPGVTIAEANDPQFAAGYMVRVRNVAGCTAQQGAKWLTDPHGAQLAAARCIEGATSAEPYSAAQIAQGQQFGDLALSGGATVTTPTATPLALQLPGFPAIPTPSIPGVKGLGSLAGAAAGIAGTLAHVVDALSSPDFWVSIVLVLAGLFIGFNGFSVMVRGSSAGRAATAAEVMA